MQGHSPLPRWRVFLLGCGVLSLVLGSLGGLWRLGWNIPLPGTEPATFHGALMAAAFFGTVIGLERAVSYAKRSAYFGPLCSSVGGCATALGAPHLLSAALLLTGSVMLAAHTYVLYRRRPIPQQLVLLVGALCGAGGNLLWLLGLPASQSVGAWIAFVVLTGSSERLLHSHRQDPPPAALKQQTALAGLMLAGAVALPLYWQTGAVLLGLALAGCALWLAAHDTAHRNLRHHGQMRFSALGLLGGYFWLGVGGLLLPFAAPATPLYDAALHAIFLGFVFALLMAQAPTLIPALVGGAVPYTRLFYGHVVLLNATLLLRIAGDLAQRPEWRAWGGLGNAAALLLFLALTIASATRGRQQEDS